MSDLNPEFRPLSFPRSDAASPAIPAAPFAPQHAEHHSTSHPGPDCDGDYEMEDELCDDTCDFDAEHDAPSIAGRIGATPDGEQSSGELVEMMLRLGQRLRGHLDTRFGTFGLSDARFAALSVIREAAPAGCTQAHLATKLGQCESSISTLVERMRSSRLLYRLRAKSDRRKRVLMLTDDGRQLFDQGLAARDREADALFNRISAEERQQLATLLGRLFASLDAIGEPERTLERPAA
jgi:MarR family transcriptional regulator for hemolysin